MTPCERLGYKVGMRFKEVGCEWFDAGSVITLFVDDGTDMPSFKGPHLGDKELMWVRLGGVKPIIRVRAGEPFSHLLPKPPASRENQHFYNRFNRAL